MLKMKEFILMNNKKAKKRDSILCFIVSAFLYALFVFLLFVEEILAFNLVVGGTIFLIIAIVFLIKSKKSRDKNDEETDKNEKTDDKN